MVNRLKKIVRRLRKIIQHLFIFISKILLIFLFKIIGPPRILRYGNKINVPVCSPVVLHSAKEGFKNLTIKDGCFINGNNFLDLSAHITLEKGVSLGPGVIIMTHNRYNHNPFLEDRLAHTCGFGDVLIKEGAGIKANALIIHGITIGKNAVVAGHAVVNRDVGDNCFVAGVPAHVVKEIT